MGTIVDTSKYHNSCLDIENMTSNSVNHVPSVELTTGIKEQIRNIPRGKAKSGRAWKTVRTGRYSEIRKTKAFSSSWEEKIKQKKDKRAVKLHEQQLKETLKKEKEEKRARKEENLKRRLENEKKAEVTQKIKNTAKIKRMKKKQLRMIAKR